jgi:putative inorganic carbon (HCO3(-)) transporter
MIDWPGVGTSALWIVGLALMFAAFSRAHWLAGRRQVPFRTILGAPPSQMALDSGLVLVCISLLLGARSAWERAAGLALALLSAGLATVEWRRGRLPQSAVGPAESFVVTTSVVPGWLRTWVGRAELWCTLAAVPFLLVPGRLSLWALAGITLLWLARWVAMGHLTVRTAVDWPVLALILWLPVAVWASADRNMTLPALYRLIAGIALFYALVNWASSWSRLAIAAALLVLIGVGLATLALFAATNWGSPKLFNAAPILARLQAHGQALIPEGINANVLAGGLALMVPVAAALLLARLGGSALTAALLRLLVALSLLWMMAILLLTQSRGAFLAVAVALAVMAALRWPLLRVLFPLSGLAVVLLLARGGAGQWQRVADAVFSTGTVTSLSERQEVWSRAIYMIQDFPYTGIGLGTFDRVQPLLYPFFLTSGEAHHAHNLFLQVAVDLGLPGLIAYLALLIGTLYTTWHAWQRANPHPPSPDRRLGEGSGVRPDRGLGQGSGVRSSLSLGLLGSQVTLLVHGLLDATAWANKLAVIPWFVLGLAVALERWTA